MNIIVNGRAIETMEGDLSYDDIVWMARRRADHTVVYTVTYSHKGATGMLAGSLIPGEKVTVREGMVFNVALTGAA